MFVLCAACASRPAQPPQLPDSEQYLPPDVEALSLLGKPLHPPQLAPEVQKQREDALAAAQAGLEKDPDNAGAALAVADRLADLGEYREAIDAMSDAIRRHPDDPRLYLARGRAALSLRRFRDAVGDLETAEIAERTKRDADVRQQILYHLGLANYLLGDFDQALAAYRECLPLSENPDRLVATTNWMYMTLRRLGRRAEAEELLEPISIDLDVKDNFAYHKLLLMYEGEIAPEELEKEDPNTTGGATILYGLGNWRLIGGEPGRAIPLWHKVLGGNQAFSFGYIAAEAELARLDKTRPSPAQ